MRTAEGSEAVRCLSDSQTEGESMAQAGYCSECSANVWLGPDGSCANGHPASSVSNVYEATDSPAPAVVPAPKKSKTLWIVLAVVGVLLLCGLGSCVAAGALLFNARSTAQGVFMDASSNAQEKSCFANQRTVAGAFETYTAIQDTTVETPEDWDGLMSLLIPSVLKSEPKCLAGGVYSVSPTDDGVEVTCSVHGSVGELPTP